MRHPWVLASAVMVVLSAAGSPARAQCPPQNLFQTPGAPYSTGSAPFHVATGDFNGDSFIDIAVAVNGLSSVGIMLGYGDGTFSPILQYHVAPGVGHLVVADLDGDGVLDVVANSAGTNALGVLRGRGDGTFFPVTMYPTGSAPYGVAVADFNRDGVLDLASSDFTASTVSVLRGLPSGGYAPRTSTGVGLHPYDLQTADLNHDGSPDLVTTNQDDQSVSVLLGHGDGTFSPAVRYVVQQYPYSVAISDFDDDGNFDLAVANGGTGRINILRGTAAGTFILFSNLNEGVQPRQVIAADVNHDAVEDLLVADYDGHLVVLLGGGSVGHGDGTFGSPVPFVADVTPTGLACGDFNGDGGPDVAVANYQNAARLTVLFNRCPQSVVTTTTLAVAADSSGCVVQATLTATVSPTPPAGNVTFYDRSTRLGTTAISGGVAVLAIPSLAIGMHDLTAAFGGYDDMRPSVSPAVALHVGESPVAITLDVAVDSSGCTATADLVAHVDPPVIGQIEFLDGSTSLALVAVTSGVAAFNDYVLSAGTHTLTARAAPNGRCTGTSAPVVIDIEPHATTTTLSAPDTSRCGDVVTLVATIAPAQTGQVRFFDGTDQLGVAQAVGGQASLDVTDLARGMRQLTAQLQSSGLCLPSTSAIVEHVVLSVPTALTLACNADTSESGANVTLTARMTAAGPHPAGILGNVRFLDGATVLGIVVGARDSAILTVPLLGEGAHTLTAEFDGPCFESSASPPLDHYVTPTPASAITVTSAPNPSVVDTPVQLVAHLSPSNVTGTVTFLDNGGPIGSAQVAAGSATITVTFGLGTHRLTAFYGGDALHPPGTSPPYDQIVYAPGPSGPVCRVEYPNGGETLNLGQVVTLRWDPQNVPLVWIYIARHPWVWETIAADVPNTGEYAWTVTGPPTTQARICVVDQSGKVGADVSNGPFTIPDAPTPTLVTEFAAEPRNRGIHLQWRVDPGVTLTLERASAVSGPWYQVVAERHAESGVTEVDDADVERGVAYWYRLVLGGAGGTTFGPIQAQAASPVEFAIARVWPNPCSGALNVELDVARPGRVVVGLVDLAGREVHRLVDRDAPRGRLAVAWDRGDRRVIPSGIYFLHYDAGGQRLIRRVVVID